MAHNFNLYARGEAGQKTVLSRKKRRRGRRRRGRAKRQIGLDGERHAFHS
ncbi:hypothetical protein [Azospirillum palustre]